MLTYKKGLSIKNYLKRRFISIYPMFWVAYAIVFLYYFYKYFAINPFSPEVPKWTFALSIIGLDGYLSGLIPNYYILGEWFLGCIIIFYFLFPALRYLLIKFPKILAISSLVVYFIVIQNYIFELPIDYNILTRLPEFLFGMYFVQYFKKVNVYAFLVSLALVIFMLFVEIPSINYMYTISLFGIPLFIVLAFIGQQIGREKIQKPFCLLANTLLLFS